jgi:hypothetical protein
MSLNDYRIGQHLAKVVKLLEAISRKLSKIAQPKSPRKR